MERNGPLQDWWPAHKPTFHSMVFLSYPESQLGECGRTKIMHPSGPQKIPWREPYTYWIESLCSETELEMGKCLPWLSMKFLRSAAVSPCLVRTTSRSWVWSLRRNASLLDLWQRIQKTWLPTSRHNHWPHHYTEGMVWLLPSQPACLPWHVHPSHYNVVNSGLKPWSLVEASVQAISHVV